VLGQKVEGGTAPVVGDRTGMGMPKVEDGIAPQVGSGIAPSRWHKSMALPATPRVEDGIAPLCWISISI
jgi:hypothetical protein